MRSLWLAEALALESTPVQPLLGDLRADVCIVGGGFTGLWTALRLKELEPSLDVVILEADICGGGASGRNGGFVLSWWAKFATLAKVCGSEEALRLAAASADAVDAIGAFCSRHGINADYRRDGWLWTATSAAQLGAWHPTLAALEAHGVEPFVELHRDEVARRAGSATHLAGVFEATAATVQPAQLARGLRRVAAERGVRIFEQSRMTRLERSRPPRVHTAHGAVTARCVVLALNAWAAAVREVRRSLVVIASDMIATPPLPERMEALGWGGLGISDSRLLVNYFRGTQDGRVAFGKGGGALAFGGRVGRTFEGRSPREGGVATSFHRLYPQLGDVPVEFSWTGPIDRSTTGLPFFVRVGGRPDVLCGAGYSGNGVGPSYLGGMILASLALKRDDEWSAAGLVGAALPRFPPEPLRFAGGILVRRAVARKEWREDENGRPRPWDQMLAKLAPSGLVPTNTD